MKKPTRSGTKPGALSLAERQVKDLRLMAEGRGGLCLFTGASGTGKTLAAETLASEVGKPLHSVTLAEVVAKDRGETEKNLQRVLDKAQAAGAILFFDEADALFGKRTAVKDSHDRFANQEVSYLLQDLERYKGIVILTSNNKDNLDRAQRRRMGLVIDFAEPKS